MLPCGLVSDYKAKKYENDCKEFDEIIKMFRELGTGNLDRRDVANNITEMVKNGLLDKINELVDDIESYEEYGGLYI